MGNINIGLDTQKRAAEKDLVFLETFQNRAAVEENGGVVNGVDIANGVATFADDNDYINYTPYFNWSDSDWSLLITASLNTGLTAQFRGIITTRVGAVGNWWTFGLYNSGKMAIETSGGATQSTYDPAGAGDITYLVTHDASITTIKVYYSVDNFTTAIITRSYGATTLGDISSELRLGTWLGSANTWKGTIKQIRIFNRVIETSEALAYYNGTMWTYDQHCVLALPMNLRDHKPEALEIDAGLIDGDMEAADVSAWTATSGTLSKVTTDPQAGSQNLRSTATVGAGAKFPSAYQDILTIGKRYRITGYARSDGSHIPLIANATVRWTGTTETSWQYFDISITATATILQFVFQVTDPVGTEYVDFDSITVTELQSYTKDRSGNGNDAIFGGGVVANYPTFSDGRYTFDGTNDYIEVNLGSTPDDFTISVYFKWNSNDTANLIFVFYDSDKKYYLLTKSTDTIFIGFNNKYTGILAGLYNQFNNDNVLSFVFKKGQDYADVYLNGNLHEQKTSGTLDATTTDDVANNILVGGTTTVSQYAECDINSFFFHNTALNPTQIRDLFYRMEAIESQGRAGQ
jgi:hypothetical protein